MTVLTVFVAIVSLSASVDNLAYRNWLSASATVVQVDNSEQSATSSSSRSITSCPVIRFSDRTEQAHEVSSACVETTPSGDRRRSNRLNPAFWRGQTVTVWYDPEHPSRTLIAEHKPQFNPLVAVNTTSLFLGSMAAGFWVGAKLVRDELRRSNLD
ncbi:DUF3592 domain-containing protein [Nodosilinea sp. FACHB-13]|uniref:DUF3592 domain-containing protein n=1 Tax=Cyanophyceae TaxID=3028117 RepID=UPI0019C51820|nr:DUF3592 domain-containing protein [Nodosilinea sp. FACHB-13]MBD2108719.1 DUF3592 domain-containing protein [Nodosilinea sp. FACHB-13]